MSDQDDEKLLALLKEVEVEVDIDEEPVEAVEPEEEEVASDDTDDDDGDDDKPDHSDDDEEEESEPHEEDAERARKREERRRKKENRDRAKQRTIRENRQLNEALRERDRQIESLTKQVAAVAQNMTGANLRAIDQEVAQLEYDFQIVENARQEAIQNNNIADYDKAERVKARLIAKYHEAQALKQQKIAEMAAPPPAPPKQENPYLAKFMKNNPWFKPSDATDKNTQIAIAISNSLVSKGKRDDTPQFWRELQQEIDDAIDADPEPRQQRQKVGGPKINSGKSNSVPTKVTIPKNVRDAWVAAGIPEGSEKFKKAAKDYYLASKQPK
jgi:hypothetical protein